MMIQYAFKKSQYAHKYLGYVLGEAMHKTKPKKTTYIARAVYIPRQDLKVNCVSVGLSEQHDKHGIVSMCVQMP